MAQGFQITITPAFEPEIIMQETLGKFWTDFQDVAYNELPYLILNYMKTIVSQGRRSGSTGNLANAITLWKDPNTSAHIHWGIGHIPTLKTQAPYYYVVNYGGFVPGGGLYRPVMFRDGSHPNSALRGSAPKGSPRASMIGRISQVGGYAPSPIRPMNYISKTTFELEMRIKSTLAIIKR